MKSNNAVIEDAYNTLYEYLFKREYESRDLVEKFASNWHPGYKATQEWRDWPTPEARLFDCMMELRAAIEAAAAKSVGRGELRRALVAILKNAGAITPECLQKAYYDPRDDSTVVCDSYQFVKFPGRFDGIPYNDPGCEYFDYRRILPNPDTMMKLPALAELKAYLKTKRKDPEANKGGCFHIKIEAQDESGFFVWVDPKYLLNILTAVGDGAICKGTAGKPFMPLAFEGADSKTYALLVPLRIF